MAFNVDTVLRLTSLTARQVRYWDTTGLVSPSIRPAKGRGSKRLYSFEDLVELRTVARLLSAGISLQKVRRVVEQIKGVRDVARPLASLRFLTDGDTVFIPSNESQRWENALRGGQVVWLVPVDEVWRTTEEDVRGIGEATAGKVKVGAREYSVTYEPDLEDGGWIAECTDIPGCISQGENLTEARRMIRDAIEAMRSADPVVEKKTRRAK